MSQDKLPSVAPVAEPARAKDVNENKVSLLTQSSNLIKSTKPTSTTTPDIPPPTAASSKSASKASTVLVSGAGTNRETKTVSNMSRAEEPEMVTNLPLTLQSDKLRAQFRVFLRTKLDQNKSDNLEHKKMFEQWLDYVLICKQVFELPETDIETKTNLMITIGSKFLSKPPDGYNLALKSQLNRKELANHCHALAEKVPDLSPDQDLLKDGYEFIFGKLEQKHDIFKKTYVPTTTLAALLCSVL